MTPLSCHYRKTETLETDTGHVQNQDSGPPVSRLHYKWTNVSSIDISDQQLLVYVEQKGTCIVKSRMLRTEIVSYGWLYRFYVLFLGLYVNYSGPLYQ